MRISSSTTKSPVLRVVDPGEEGHDSGVEGEGGLGLLVEHHTHRVHRHVRPAALEQLAGPQHERGVTALDEGLDLIVVEVLEVGAEVAGVVEEDLDDGGARRGGPRCEGPSVGPGGSLDRKSVV